MGNLLTKRRSSEKEGTDCDFGEFSNDIIDAAEKLCDMEGYTSDDVEFFSAQDKAPDVIERMKKLQNDEQMYRDELLGFMESIMTVAIDYDMFAIIDENLCVNELLEWPKEFKVR